MTALVVLEGVVIALLAVLVVGLLRSHADVLRQLHEVAGHERAGDGDTGDLASGNDTVALADRGAVAATDNPIRGRTVAGVPEPREDAASTLARAHDVSGRTPEGAAVAVGVVGADHTTLLAFLTSGCGTCQAHWQAFGAGKADVLPGRDTRLVVVTRGADRESAAAVAPLAPPNHTTVMSTEAWDDYRVPASPYFILVDGPSGRVVGEGAAADWDRVVQLLQESAAEAGVSPDGAAVTTPVPENRLSGRDRADRVKADLAAAGIEPGHASLYPSQLGEVVPETVTPDTNGNRS